MDHLIAVADRALRALVGAGGRLSVASPGLRDPGTLSGSLLRVDHAGEVCAQALYLSQSLFARQPQLRTAMLRSADDEGAHLRWTADRLAELSARPSVFNPAWFAGAFLLGGLSSAAGDRFSRGFLAETERQVGQHLAAHLRRLPIEDSVSRTVLRQMRIDERTHASVAEGDGGTELPHAFRWAMRVSAKVMTVAAAHG